MQQERHTTGRAVQETIAALFGLSGRDAVCSAARAAAGWQPLCAEKRSA
ncbi:MAG: hypothetical protein ACI4TG_10645 [Ruminococcus sp.]